MNKAMDPAEVTKPEEYQTWESFYSETFASINEAITAQDFNAFRKEYTAIIESCNACHDAMGDQFIKVMKLEGPVDRSIDYSLKSKATDVPKQKDKTGATFDKKSGRPLRILFLGAFIGPRGVLSCLGFLPIPSRGLVASSGVTGWSTSMGGTNE